MASPNIRSSVVFDTDRCYTTISPLMDSARIHWLRGYVTLRRSNVEATRLRACSPDAGGIEMI